MANSNKLEEKNIANTITKVISRLDDVSSLAETGITEKTKSVLGRGNEAKGIKLSIENNGIIAVSLHINVFYGVNIPQLSYDIQSKIKDELERCYDCHVNSVNVYVEGIDKKKED